MNLLRQHPAEQQPAEQHPAEQQPAEKRPPVLRTRRARSKASLATVLLAAAAAGGVWLVAVRGAGVRLEVAASGDGPGHGTVGLGAVLVATLAAGLVGWGVLALLTRTSRPVSQVWAPRVWVVLASAATLLSLSSPLTMAASPAAATTLCGMHVVVAAVLVPGLLRAAYTRDRGGLEPAPASREGEPR